MAEQTRVTEASVQTELSLNETASRLGSRADALFDGKNLHLGFIEKDALGQDFINEDQKKQEADGLAKKINDTKTADGKPALGKELTGQEILGLQKKVVDLIESGRFAGVYLNVLGGHGQDGEQSALTSIVILDYLTRPENAGKSPKELIDGAIKLIDQTEIFKIVAPAGMSFALVLKNGEMYSSSHLQSSVVILRADGQQEKISPVAGEVSLSKTSKISQGDRIILCGSEAAKRLGVEVKTDGTTQEIVDGLSKPAKNGEPAQTVTAAKVEKKSAVKRKTVTKEQMPKESLVGVKDQIKERVLVTEKPDGKKASVLDYVKSEEYIKNNAVLDSVLKIDETGLDPKIVQLCPPADNESPQEYLIRLYSQIEKEIRTTSESLRNPDSLITYLYSKDSIRSLGPINLLTTVEASRKLLQHELSKGGREAMIERLRAQFKTKERTSEVKTQVVEDGSVKKVEGPFMPLRTQEGEFQPEVQADISSFRFLEDYLGDINIADLTTQIKEKKRDDVSNKYNQRFTGLLDELNPKGQKITFRGIAVALKQKIDNAASYDERFAYKTMYARVRHVFYGQIEQALQYREAKNLEAVTPFVQGIITKLNRLTLTPDAMEKAIAKYQGFGATEDWKEKSAAQLKEVLIDRNNHPLLFDYALKGAEYFIRMAKKPVKLQENPDLGIVTEKMMIQGPQAREVYIPESLKEAAGIVETPPAEEPPSPAVVVPPEPGKEPSPQPVSPEPTPVLPKTPEQPNTPEPPPQPKPEENPPTPPGPPPIPQQELVTSFDFAGVALKDRRVQNVLQLTQHSFAHDLKKMPVPRYAKIPIIGGIAWSFRHPIKMIWQNSIARSVFEQQHMRFVSSLVDTVKKTSDSSVPIEVTQELLDKAFDEAKAAKAKQSWVKRRVNGTTDFIKGILGVGQTSEQKLARSWLTQEIGKSADQRVQELKQVDSRVLVEQDDLGRRFADLKGLTLDQANRFIAKDAGETRYQLPVEQRAEVNKVLKGFVEQYAKGSLTKEQLVIEVDKYLLGDFRKLLTTDQQKEFAVPEAASNILSIADSIKANWGRYQEEKTSTEKSKWDEVDLNIYFGKGEWGGVRGKVEMGFFAEKLARRLAERPNLWGKAGGGAVALARDVITNAAMYGAGWFISGKSVTTGLLARLSLGYVPGIVVGAGIKEAGIALPGLSKVEFTVAGHRFTPFMMKGRYIKEVEQLSREAARGRISPEEARIRKEMTAGLVNRVNVSQATQEVEGLLAKSELNPVETKKLVLMLANLDARMRLSDLSGRRELAFKAQNYLEFAEGQENEQYLKLKSALINGAVRLTQSGNWDQFDKYSKIAEAQLRFSSSDTVKMRKFLMGELKLSQQDTDAMLNTMFSDVNLNIQKNESLRQKEAVIRKLSLKRAGKTGMMAFITAPIAGIGMKGLVSVGAEIPHFIGDLGHGGPAEYIKDWGDILRGDVPMRIDTGGHLISDMTPLQQATLHVRNMVEPPVDFAGVHNDVIDGVHLQLPGGLRHTNVDLNHDGTIDHEAIVDIRTGKVLFDMSDGHLGLQGKNLVFVDNSGHAIDATAAFQKAGIGLSSGPDIVNTKTIDVLIKSGVQEVKIDGHTTYIPSGTEWIHDPVTGKLDLVMTADHSKVLINDAYFNFPGKLVTPNGIDAHLNFDHGAHTRIEVHSGPDAVADWEKLGTQIDHREWYSYDQPGSQGNELMLYTYKDGNTVILDMSKMGMAHQQGLTPNPISVPDVIKNHEGGFTLNIPGAVDKPVWIPDGADGKWDGMLKLDPNDNIHTISFPDGSTHTLGEIATNLLNHDKLTTLQDGNIATEYFGHQDVFRLGTEKEWGSIEAGRMVNSSGNNVFQAFATIRGSNGAQFDHPVTDYIPKIDMADTITKTVTDLTPTFVMSAPEVAIPGIPLIPLYMRQNIERSVSSDKAIKTSTPDEKPTPVKPGSPAPGPAQEQLNEDQKQLKQRKEKLAELEEREQKKLLAEVDKVEMGRLKEEIAELEARIKLEDKSKINPEIQNLSHEQQILLAVIANKNSKIDLDNLGLEKINFNQLLAEFQKDPVTYLRFVVEYIREQVKQSILPVGEKEQHISKLVDEYMGLMTLLDHKAFPPTKPEDRVIKEVPSYIPDGLSDMGEDPEIDESKRGREKIRVDKKNIFDQSKDFIHKLFLTEYSDKATPARIDDYIIRMISDYVYRNLPYDYKDKPIQGDPNKSILLSSIKEQELSKCRHHALYAQSLLQLFGIDSRLLKSIVTFEDGGGGNHGNNLVRIDGKWYLLDATNPLIRDRKIESIYLYPIQETTIDLNAKHYEWKIVDPHDPKKKRAYESRNLMYYRIRDNEKHQVN